MIKATELRIGNLVMRNNKFDGMPRITKLVSMMIFQAEKEPEEFEAIPITCEWLERMGFSDAAQNGGLIRYQSRGSGWTTQLPHIKFVHQLQNLFFALTGEELTIKP